MPKRKRKTDTRRAARSRTLLKAIAENAVSKRKLDVRPDKTKSVDSLATNNSATKDGKKKGKSKAPNIRKHQLISSLNKLEPSQLKRLADQNEKNELQKTALKVWEQRKRATLLQLKAYSAVRLENLLKATSDANLRAIIYEAIRSKKRSNSSVEIRGPEMPFRLDEWREQI